MLTGAMVQGAGLAGLVFARYGYPVLVIAVLLMAAGEMIYAPTVAAFVTTRAGRHRRASYQAAVSITEDIGTAIGPVSGLALATAARAVTVWPPALPCVPLPEPEPPWPRLAHRDNPTSPGQSASRAPRPDVGRHLRASADGAGSAYTRTASSGVGAGTVIRLVS